MATSIPIYQIDAFTTNVFGGNPAAVCVLKQWLSDALMQSIATENNQAETAFIVLADDKFEIRWFTPSCEVDLCGHATLAAAYVIFKELNYKSSKIEFVTTKRGSLYVTHIDSAFELDFPVDLLEPTSLPYGLVEAFNVEPIDAFRGKDDYLLVFENESQIRSLEPNFEAISSVDARGVICTAKGDNVDFVSRFFGPQSGIDEDPVTGSAHTSLAPYWSEKLSKSKFTACQLSKRGGYLEVSLVDKRVKISGSAVLYLKGTITV